MKKLLIVAVTMGLLSALVSCKSKVKDEDIKRSVEETLVTIPSHGPLTVTVQNGTATIDGMVTDLAAKTSIQPTLNDKKIKGLKSVVDNTTVYVAETPVITPDDPLKQAVQDAVKDNPGVTAQVNDGVVTLTGTIAKADLPKLMQKINATRPKKVENQLTIK